MPADAARHLDNNARINLGAYYTKENFVDTVWRMIKPHLRPQTVILDSSCGAGNFFKPEKFWRQIGGDIDNEAAENIKSAGIEFYNQNALYRVGRFQYRIDDKAHLCIIGNPPYNDRTSLVRHKIKNGKPPIDEDIAARDLGLSFLLSYQKLQADVVCVLHPLSYLIKPSNFRALKIFAENYRLVRGEIISSGVFAQSSKTTHFPIVIALYLKSRTGMIYRDMLNFRFQVQDGHPFAVGDFDTIANYVRKYPSRRQKPKKDDLLFWTLRDLNALRRNRTFVEKPGANTIIVDKTRLDYYLYIDVIKEFSAHIPYYFGNCDILIDDHLFKHNRKYFIIEALSRRPELKKYYPGFDVSADSVISAQHKIRAYIKEFIGLHYVN